MLSTIVEVDKLFAAWPMAGSGHMTNSDSTNATTANPIQMKI